MPSWIYAMSVSALHFRPILCSGAGAHRKARGARKAAVAAECVFCLPCTQNFVLREHLIFSTVNTDFCCSVNTFARRLLICTLI
jgi:hypothetical protein